MMHQHKIAKDSSPISKDAPRKRVARACDRCRLKKGKCDGKEQCAKCVSADVMCIYTDRKPPQHKLISPAVADALQSENLTLKKATIIIFKQLMDAQGGDLPTVEGVDWASEKVANGKSGRALNYIISQQARVDNRISNEEIANYDSDTQMLDSSSSRTCPGSPASRQSSPQSAAGDSAGAFWDAGIAQQQQHAAALQRNHRKVAKYGGYTNVTDVNITSIPTTMHVHSPSTAAYIDPNLLQPTGSIGSASNHPPTPPTALDSLDMFPPGPMQWPNQHQQHQQQQSRLYYERYNPQRCYDEEVHHNHHQSHHQSRGSEVMCGDNSMHWGPPGPDLYQFFVENKDLGKVFEQAPVAGDVPMYDREM
ncbi:hypothetical protein BDD12DRAFT_803316 [Trichophaea hybrida]|nr:hypothetical protein BDD12DRAFT_803316 [Trichophaea hybrida]